MSHTAIVVFAFGQPSTTAPNTYLANLARDASLQEDNAPIYTQRDIVIPERGSICVHYFPGEELENPPPTLRIARWFVKHHLEDTQRVIIVAAEPHLGRVCRDMRYVIKEEAGMQVGMLGVKLEFPGVLLEQRGRVWFCPESVQKRTTSWWRWWLRELPLRLLPLRLYVRVAS